MTHPNSRCRHRRRSHRPPRYLEPLALRPAISVGLRTNRLVTGVAPVPGSDPTRTGPPETRVPTCGSTRSRVEGVCRSHSSRQRERALVVIGHLGVNVDDLEAAAAYYAGLMPLVGFEPFLSSDDEFAYRPKGGKPGTYLFFYRSNPASDPNERSGYSRHATGLQHLAFMVSTRAAVAAVHEWVTAGGGEVLHPPQDFPQYPPPYFATFWLDPFGFMLEAVCHHDRDG